MNSNRRDIRARFTPNLLRDPSAGLSVAQEAPIHPRRRQRRKEGRKEGSVRASRQKTIWTAASDFLNAIGAARRSIDGLGKSGASLSYYLCGRTNAIDGVRCLPSLSSSSFTIVIFGPPPPPPPPPLAAAVLFQASTPSAPVARFTPRLFPPFETKP